MKTMKTMKNGVRSLSVLAALGVLATACAASTDPTESSASSAAAVTTGCQNNSANADVTFVNTSNCYDLTSGTNTAFASSYSSDACNSFTAEWDGTTANPNGLFTVTLTPEPTTVLTSGTCPTTTASLTVYGLEVTVNRGSDTVDWIPITSASVPGNWANGYCQFGPNSDAVSVSFSDQVQGPGPTTVRRYEDIKVVAQVTQPAVLKVKETLQPETLHPESPFFTSYQPFAVHIEEEYCH